MSDLEQWPEQQLGLGLLRGFRYAPRDSRQLSKMEAGAGVSRLKSRDAVVDHRFTLSFTGGQEAYFRWWYHNKINQGVDWFSIRMRTGAGINTVPAFFVKVGESRLVGQRFQIQGHLMVRGLPATQMTEEQVLALVEHDAMPLQAGADQLHQTIHSDQD
ncbi:MAG: hypothetical protein OIF55_14700 [Amphritea sp.]|nr:hypothetical protein [Amphritea sp.]